MGYANRAMRRKQVREQMHEWVRMGKIEQPKRLTQNGISQKDLDSCFEDGHKAGFHSGEEFFVDKFITLTKLSSALTVTNEHCPSTYSGNHFAVYFAGERAKVVFIEVLCSNHYA